MVSLIIVILLGIMWMGADILSSKPSPQWLKLLTLIGLILAGISVKFPIALTSALFNFSPISILFNLLILIFTGLGLVKIKSNHVIALMLFSTVGALMMTSWSHLIILFLGIETMSIPLYFLAGSKLHSQKKSQEAALKYFLLGSFASCFLLLGIALFFATTGTLTLSLAVIIPLATSLQPLTKAGILLIILGLMFKVGGAPFHTWIPDVYEGSPNPITGWMAPMVKTAAFCALLEILISLSPATPFITPALWSIALLSALGGTLAAAQQTSLTRMLAYSGIANVGYILLLLTPLTLHSIQALWVYLFTYGLTFIFLFWILQKVDSVPGLWQRKPKVAIGLTFGLLSLAGVPPLPGFWAKWLFLQHILPQLPIWLVIPILLSIAIGFYVYYRLLIPVFKSQ